MEGLVASRTSFDFGEIPKGAVVERSLTLGNDSNETLRLTPWRSCGCTTPVLQHNVLEPGDTTSFKIVFDSTGKSGYQEKKVGVNYYLGGEPKALSITFTAKIKK